MVHIFGPQDGAVGDAVLDYGSAIPPDGAVIPCGVGEIPGFGFQLLRTETVFPVNALQLAGGDVVSALPGLIHLHLLMGQQNPPAVHRHIEVNGHLGSCLLSSAGGNIFGDSVSNQALDIHRLTVRSSPGIGGIVYTIYHKVGSRQRLPFSGRNGQSHAAILILLHHHRTEGCCFCGAQLQNQLIGVGIQLHISFHNCILLYLGLCPILCNGVP